jgi:hypothetical protein
MLTKKNNKDELRTTILTWGRLMVIRFDVRSAVALVGSLIEREVNVNLCDHFDRLTVE